jgi:hypothetical protein
MDNLLRQTKHTAITFALLLAGQAMLTAQEKNAAPTAKPAQLARAAQPAKAPQEQAPPVKLPQERERPQPSDAAAMNSKVFRVFHRDPIDLGRILEGFQSDHPDAMINPYIMGDLKLLTVRDFHRQVALMEEALKVIDVPEAKAQAYELTINLLWASKKDFKGDPVPSSLSGVVDSISKAMNYSHFRDAGIVMQRGMADGKDVFGSGMLPPLNQGTSNPDFTWGLRRTKFDAPGVLSGTFSASVLRAVIRDAAFSLKEGDKLVIGTAMHGEYALIVVLSMKVINN